MCHIMHRAVLRYVCVATSAALPAMHFFNEVVRDSKGLSRAEPLTPAAAQLEVKPGRLVACTFLSNGGEGNELFRLLGVVTGEASAAAAAEQEGGAAKHYGGGSRCGSSAVRYWRVEWDNDDIDEACATDEIEEMALPVVASRCVPLLVIICAYHLAHCSKIIFEEQPI
jgi:hypothetical protein